MLSRLIGVAVVVAGLWASEANSAPMTCEQGKARLADANELVRANAVAALASCPDGVQRLTALLSDPKYDRIAVVNTLGRMGERATEALPKLTAVLQDRGVASLYAAGAIVTIDPKRAPEVAPTWLRFIDDKDLYNVAVALEQLARPELAQLVPLKKAAKLARSKDEHVRMHALNVLQARAQSTEVAKLAEAALRRCSGVTPTCHFGEESPCHQAADFDADGTADVATLVKRRGKRAVAVIARGRCQLWTLADGEGGGWTLFGDERGGGTRLLVSAGDGTEWLLSLRGGKLRGEQQDHQ